MPSRHVVAIVAVAIAALTWTALPLSAQIPLKNWTAVTNADLGHNSPFQAIAPCRLVDTRNAPGAFGGPKFSASQTRTFAIPSGPCTGIPVAEAYSLNFTVIDFGYAGGFLTAWQSGVTRPTVSTVNFSNTPAYAVANAAVVPASGGSINVFASAGTHLIIDINGYYTNEVPVGKQLMVVADYAGGAAVYGHNDSDINGSHGVGGYADGTGAVHGVQGGTAGYAGASGVHGYTAAHAGTFGLFGEALGDVVNYGLYARHTYHTLDSAGVLAVAGTRVSVPAGVQEAAIRAEADSGDGIVAYINTGGIVGVTAAVYNTADPPVQVLRGSLAWQSGGYAVYGWGNYGGTGVKFFVDPHPTDPSKVIRFVALEGNQPTTFFRGRARFQGGQAIIAVPEEFRFVTEDDSLTVNVTPIGAVASVGVTAMNLDQIVVESSVDVDFSYIVYGVRKGYKDFQPIVKSPDFVPTNGSERMPDYLNESQRARLIENGTYNPDGTINMSTALRLGWDKAWTNQTK